MAGIMQLFVISMYYINCWFLNLHFFLADLSQLRSQWHAVLSYEDWWKSIKQGKHSKKSLLTSSLTFLVQVGIIQQDNSMRPAAFSSEEMELTSVGEGPEFEMCVLLSLHLDLWTTGLCRGMSWKSLPLLMKIQNSNPWDSKGLFKFLNLIF